MRAVSVIIGFSLFFSCASSGKPVIVKDPTDNTEEAKLKAYETYRAKEVVPELVLQEDGTSSETGRNKAVILMNGEEVSNPSLLSQAVPANSASKKAIDSYQKHKKKERLWRAVTIAGWGVSIGTLTLAATQFTNPDDTFNTTGKIVSSISGVTFLALIVPFAYRLDATIEKKKDRSLAFTTYNESLLSRWNLCQENEQIFDCAKAPDIAAAAIAAEPTSNKSVLETCQESRAIGESLSEECQNLLRRGAPQKAPNPEDGVVSEPDPTEEEFSLLLNLAEVRMRVGKNDEAIVALQEAKKLKPDETIVDFALGEIERNKGNPTEACTHYHDFLKSPGSNVDNINKVKTYLAGVDKTKNKTCQFDPEKP